MIPTEINDRKRKKGRLVGGTARGSSKSGHLRNERIAQDLFRSRRMRRMRDSVK